MSEEINAVTTALNKFAAYYSDSEVIQWGLVFTASWGANGTEQVVLKTDLVDFQTFMNIFASSGFALSGADEQNYDAIYLAIHNLVGAAALPHQLADLKWASNPANPLHQDPTPDLQQTQDEQEEWESLEYLAHQSLL